MRVSRRIRMDEKRRRPEEGIGEREREREREGEMHRARLTGAQASYVSRLRYGIVGRLGSL